jgi:hypothetical protein
MCRHGITSTGSGPPSSTTTVSGDCPLGVHDFVYDTAASHSSACGTYHLKNIKDIQPIAITGVADGSLTTSQAGTVLLNEMCEVHNVLLTNSGTTNVISAHKLLAAGCRVESRPNRITVYHPQCRNTKMLVFCLQGGVYVYIIPHTAAHGIRAESNQAPFGTIHNVNSTSSIYDVGSSTRPASEQARGTYNTNRASPSTIFPSSSSPSDTSSLANGATDFAANSGGGTSEETIRSTKRGTTISVLLQQIILLPVSLLEHLPKLSKPHSSSSKPSSGTHKRSGNRPAPTPAPAHLFTHARADDDDDMMTIALSLLTQHKVT